MASTGTVVIVVIRLIALGSQGDQGCDKPAPAPAEEPGEGFFEDPDDGTTDDPAVDVEVDPDDDFSFEPETDAPSGG